MKIKTLVFFGIGALVLGIFVYSLSTNSKLYNVQTTSIFEGLNMERGF